MPRLWRGLCMCASYTGQGGAKRQCRRDEALEMNRIPLPLRCLVGGYFSRILEKHPAELWRECERGEASAQCHASGASMWMDQAGNTANNEACLSVERSSQPGKKLPQGAKRSHRRTLRVATLPRTRAGAEWESELAFEAGTWQYVRRIHTLDNFTINVLDLISNALH